MRAFLTVEKGHGTPSSLELDAGKLVTLGRSKDNVLILHDEHASRQHAQIFFDGAQWSLRDLGSFNGTLVDNLRVGEVTPLRHGQTIGIADMRLIFTVPNGTPPPQMRPTVTPPSDASATTLLADEVALLYQFMSDTVGAVDPNLVVEKALETARAQTGASVCGFLNLDAEHLLSRMVVPERAEVDTVLSKQLTQRIAETGGTVWQQGGQQLSASDSLAAYSDAVGVPVWGDEDEILGALHLYKNHRNFTAREVRFCELVAGFAAPNLARLRLLRKLEAENSRLRLKKGTSDELVGKSPAMEKLRRQLARIAETHATVLIHGETGSGKDVVAQMLHHLSPRRKGPFVAANCGAISESLIDDELFGHCRGSFTNAISDRKGLFQQADEGTLFLDEIGDLPLEGQVKLLRVIEGKPFRPVGSEREVRTDVRFIAATHRDLGKLVAAGEFREDLFFRLNVITLTVPPLRDHREDIPELAEHFLKQIPTRHGRPKVVSTAAMQRLMEFSWPGNVRQLATVLERAVVIGDDGPAIEPHELALADVGHVDLPRAWHQDEIEKWALTKLLDKHAGNLTRVAEEYGIDRGTLRTKMQLYKIDKPARS